MTQLFCWWLGSRRGQIFDFGSVKEPCICLLYAVSHLKYFRGISKHHFCTARGLCQHTGISYTKRFYWLHSEKTPADKWHFHWPNHRRTTCLSSSIINYGKCTLSTASHKIRHFLTNNYIKHKAQWRVNMTNKRTDEKKEMHFPFMKITNSLEDSFFNNQHFSIFFFWNMV